MNLVSLNCNHCGAPLQVAEDARFVTCQFCEARLSVERTGSAYFTRELEELSDKTDQLAEDVARLNATSELDRLDREWDRQREELMVSGKHGRRHVPTKGKALFSGLAAVAAGVFVLTMTRGGGPPMLMGFLILLLGGGAAAHMFMKAEVYDRAKSRYEHRRRELLARHRRDA